MDENCDLDVQKINYLGIQLTGLIEMNGCKGIVIIIKGDKRRVQWSKVISDGACLDYIQDAKKSVLIHLEKS